MKKTPKQSAGKTVTTQQELDLELMPSGDLRLVWTGRPGRMGKKQQMLNQELYRRYTDEPETWMLYLGGASPRIELSPTLHFFRSFVGHFLDRAARYPDGKPDRKTGRIAWDEGEIESLLSAPPLMNGGEYLTRETLAAIWADFEQGFFQGLKTHDGSRESFIQTFDPGIYLAGRVYFHLVENRDGTYPFQFLATYCDDAGTKGRLKHRPLQHALTQYSGDALLELLVTVKTAARQSDFVHDLLETGDIFHHLAWDESDAYAFLSRVEGFERCGIICRIPDWWRKKKASVRLSVTIGSREPSHVGMEALLDFRPELRVGETPITPEEAGDILAQSAGLARIKNQWVAVDTDRLKQVLAAYEQAVRIARKGGITIREALQMQLHPDTFQLGGAEEDIEFSGGEWLETVRKQLSRPETLPLEAVPDDLNADLRPYQIQGYQWLSLLDRLGFGACLADDMGLGKTLQVLALLARIRETDPQSVCLLVVPASLIANWENEIRRFLPDLKYGVAHSSVAKDKTVTGPPEPGSVNLVITTYAMVQKHRWTRKVNWRCLVLDEAQAIKNPAARQTRWIKEIPAAYRIIMTGTPIENSLADLWSLFDFITPGLLGAWKTFKTFASGLRKRPEGYGRLKQVVGPYILRRMKTDPAIAPELPEKVEMKTYPELSRRQVVLYTDFTAELQARLENSKEDIQRKGLILSSIIKFKQLCNHPDQYLGTGDFNPEDSGKFLRLEQLAETILAKRERMLVFTQFKEMVAPLSAFLETIFQIPGCVIHGSMGVKARREAVERFQDRDYVPFMILSLKAGGVGLNLTRANHVVHFDRWWNPAVENQATDRAYRIGQTRGVLVHTFVTRGTVEERIDRMITDKREMARAVISDGAGSGLTRLSNEELMELFRFSL